MTSPALLATTEKLATAPSPELVLEAIDDLAPKDAGGLCEAIAAANVGPHINPPEHELWPLMNARSSTFDAGGSNPFHARTSGAAGLNLVAAMDANFAGTGRFPNGILRALLYCHLLYLGTASPADELRLNELSRLQVPRLDELLTRDAARIRKDSEAFASFRSALSRGLERAQSLRTPDSMPNDARQIVAEARHQLFAEVDSNKILASIGHGLLGFVAGALAGAAGTATGTAGGLIPPLVDHIARSSNRPDFLKRHYLIFEPQRP